jgi:hemin uptake protein HemP
MTKPPADKPADNTPLPAGSAHPAGNRASRRAVASPVRPEHAPASTERATPVAGGPPRSGPGGAREREIATIASDQILKGSDAINIEHNGRIYQLRRTRQGKLILTK